ncbi:LIM/homeobox protein Lhx2-like [Schistocerca gregaria]|uniref:LIM/homeobox protein Lhx2-like n=1 Tax=Schistocerca gregaria TaxID=7010 RepID=UPI00211E5E48|nr:LIM/homeobox protein Lhx2-like [Schistocerca gregaria]
MLKEREVSAAALEASCCAGCGARICDRYFLLAADRQWHSACLRCCDCKLPLASELTCFSRDGNIYCKEDYYRLFAVKRCARCQAGISASELVMRARDLVYHVHCFTCASCGVPLAKGDHFGMRDELVYCRPHYELLYSQDAAGAPFCDLEAAFRAGAAPCGAPASPGKGRPRKRKLPSAAEPQDMPVGLRIPAAALESTSKCESAGALLNRPLEPGGAYPFPCPQSARPSRPAGHLRDGNGGAGARSQSRRATAVFAELIVLRCPESTRRRANYSRRGASAKLIA